MNVAAARVSLWLGGARSGKSRLAQSHAESLGGELIYVATGEPGDEEMTARIARHRADRGPRWRTLEVPIELRGVIEREDAADRVLLVDCLTLWVSNLLLSERNVEVATEELLEAVQRSEASLAFVSNEVGLGIVPDNELARRFRDEAGRLNQRIAAVADDVYFVAAGLVLRMK
jgi:adenosylcobinamide kinase/adenosylcobinamide-phosphate guanylyltransferase